VPKRQVRKLPSRRARLLEALQRAGRESSTATIMFHTTMAHLQGLSPTDTKALDVLDRLGPLTAGELAAQTRLAPPSVTGLINRLERKGFVRRVPDPADRRRVRIQPAPGAVSRFVPLFRDFGARLESLYARYTDDELQLVLEFLEAVTAHQREATERLREETDRGSVGP
jgi:DNA-binding MarR family transcriptional regulator